MYASLGFTAGRSILYFFKKSKACEIRMDYLCGGRALNVCISSEGSKAFHEINAPFPQQKQIQQLKKINE